MSVNKLDFCLCINAEKYQNNRRKLFENENKLNTYLADIGLKYKNHDYLKYDPNSDSMWYISQEVILLYEIFMYISINYKKMFISNNFHILL